mmetsp:Transcript_4657/g.5766  ORF Transcript_4657/g.5766 Transcript_4657/m.5766 type:complete len:157 (-) Transcript_4657:879-1349(-)
MLGQTKGPLETIAQAAEELQAYEPLPFISVDSDSFYTVNILQQYCENIGFDNAIFVTDVSGEASDKWSFVTFDHNDILTGIAEKKMISDWGSTGAYAFSNVDLFLQYADRILVVSSLHPRRLLRVIDNAKEANPYHCMDIERWATICLRSFQDDDD